ncbi:MAG TPA: hypothetical protein VLL30_08300, partial [Reyranella sp.]|nr:hypothetical protein [Reyranella sp.]
MTELACDRAADGVEQRLELRDVALAHWRELEQHRAEALAERAHAVGEQAREAHLVERLRRVGDAAVGLHTKAES